MTRTLFTIFALGFVTLPALASQQYVVSRMAQASVSIYGESTDPAGEIERAKLTAEEQLQGELYRTAITACAGGRMVTYYASQPSCTSTGSAAFCETNVNVTCIR